MARTLPTCVPPTRLVTSRLRRAEACLQESCLLGDSMSASRRGGLEDDRRRRRRKRGKHFRREGGVGGGGGRGGGGGEAAGSKETMTANPDRMLLPASEATVFGGREGEDESVTHTSLLHCSRPPLPPSLP